MNETKVERLTVWVCRICGDQDRPESKGTLPCGHAEENTEVIEVVPAQQVERLASLVERFAPHKHDTGCSMHLMHDDLYENPEPGDNPPQPRTCDCGFDEARAALREHRKGEHGTAD